MVRKRVEQEPDVRHYKGAVTVYNGVDYSAVFDYNYYISNNGDIKAAFGDDDVAVLAHFVNYGMSESRRKNC